jgi:hypothetical protein
MGIQLVADKQVEALAADGLVHLKPGAVSHPYPEVHLVLPVRLIYPQVADHNRFPRELAVPLVIPQRKAPLLRLDEEALFGSRLFYEKRALKQIQSTIIFIHILLPF